MGEVEVNAKRFRMDAMVRSSSILILLCIWCVNWTETAVLVKRAYVPERQNDYATYNQRGKRPFCNAFEGCGKKRSDPGFGASNPEAAEALAEVLANDIATGDISDWEQFMLKGMEMVDNRDQLGFLPSGDDISYLRKKREAID